MEMCLESARVANASALYRGRIPKIGKRGFRGQKTLISQGPRKGRFESKNPHFSTGLHKENGDFSTPPKPSFPDFGDFDPCTGPTRSQC